MKLITSLIAMSFTLSCNSKSTSTENFKHAPQTIVIDNIHKKANPGNRSVDTSSTPKSILIQQDTSHYENVLQETIDKAFNERQVDVITAKLAVITEDKSIPDAYRNYWTAYLYYYKSILFKNILKDDEAASKAIDKALAQIEKQLDSSEDYALYASCLSYSIQFANMIQLAKISSAVQENGEKALQLNNRNVRAYYVLASNNFYTPKMFGGMTKVEEYATKGLTCPSSIEKNNFYAPVWGKPKLYKILIKYYQQEDKTDKANQTISLAKKEFPHLF